MWISSNYFTNKILIILSLFLKRVIDIFIIKIYIINISAVRQPQGVENMTRKELAYKIAMIETEKRGQNMTYAKIYYNLLLKGVASMKGQSKAELEAWYNRIK